MKNSLVNALGIVAIAIVAIAIPNALAQTEESLVRVSGADSMFNRIQILTRVFTKNNPGIKVEVVEGQLVDMGIADLNCLATHNYETTTNRNRKDTTNGKNHFFQIPKLGHRKFAV